MSVDSPSGPASVDRALQDALAHHQAGRLHEAEALYRQVLARHPDNPTALHLLGVLSGQEGRIDVAIDLISRAITAKPDVADYHAHLGEFFRQAGETDLAVAACGRAVELRGDSPEFRNALGVALHSAGRLPDAIDAFHHAARFGPTYAEAFSNLGNALRAAGQSVEAVEACRTAVRLRPDSPAAHNNLGVALRTSGDGAAAIESFREAIRLQPDYAEAHSNLGNALRDLGRLDEAIASFRHLVILNPNHPESLHALGLSLRDAGRLEESAAVSRRAIHLRPAYAEAYNSLGVTLRDKGRLDESADSLRQAIHLQPAWAEAHSNLGSVLREIGHLDEAEAECRRAIDLQGDWAVPHNNLGIALKNQGRLDESIDCFRKAIALDPTAASVHSNLLFALWYHPDYDPRRLLAEHLRWDEQHARPLAAEFRPHSNDRTPGRRLRVGYVSPDFRLHPVGGLILPILAHHDRDQFEIFCYADVPNPDRITDRLRPLAHVWRDTASFSAAQLAEQIRDDGIDVLIDLALHTAGNRLLTFARNPAPVQASWLGYPAPTGLTAIDYRISDPRLDPPEVGDDGPGGDGFPQRIVRLPRSFWCYQPITDTPEVNPLPALTNGFVTFACFNNFAKVTTASLRLWAGVLRAVPRSRMLILSSPGRHRDATRRVFESEGVEGGRVEFIDRMSAEAYFAAHYQADVCLDPTPYPGHTTALDGLWMGVPVVTLAGATPPSRGGVTLLNNVGLSEWVAHTPEEYVEVASRVAGDLPRLASLRGELRQRMRQSPLTDGPRFTADLESAYQRMWADWCRGK